jgi:hypothetical protein
MSNDEINEGYNEFIKEYGSRYKWVMKGILMSGNIGTTFFA